MIILNIKIDNLYLFKDFEMNFTYSKKLTHSTIESEYLKNFPNFKYRKVNIIMGPNSSGKTTLGTVMRDIQNYLKKKNTDFLPFDKINKKGNYALIDVDFVVKDTLYKYELSFNSKGTKIEKMYKTKLKKDDSYITALKRLQLDKELKSSKDDVEFIQEYHFDYGWYYSFAMLTNSENLYDDETNKNILEKILKGFDCTITAVKKITDSENSFNILFKNGDNILMQNGKVVDETRISSGTFESIRLATVVTEMLNQERNYFIDENIVHSHSELEKGILSLMIEVLKDDSQLFFTTHNNDILDMDLPLHTIQFLTNKDGKIIVSDVVKKFNKRDRNLRLHVENDVFNTLPDTNFIWEILNER